jgi:hypothetical protein
VPELIVIDEELLPLQPAAPHPSTIMSMDISVGESFTIFVVIDIDPWQVAARRISQILRIPMGWNGKTIGQRS